MKILFVVNELNFFLRNHLNLAASIGKLHDVLLIADTSKSSLQDIKSLAKLNITLHPLNRKESSSKITKLFIVCSVAWSISKKNKT